MTQALNLALLANNVDSTGKLSGSAVSGAVPNSTASASLNTTNFTVAESGGKLYFYYGAVAIASMDSSGNFVQLANITAYGTP